MRDFDRLTVSLLLPAPRIGVLPVSNRGVGFVFAPPQMTWGCLPFISQTRRLDFSPSCVIFVFFFFSYVTFPPPNDRANVGRLSYMFPTLLAPTETFPPLSPFTTALRFSLNFVIFERIFFLFWMTRHELNKWLLTVIRYSSLFPFYMTTLCSL